MAFGLSDEPLGRYLAQENRYEQFLMGTSCFGSSENHMRPMDDELAGYVEPVSPRSFTSSNLLRGMCKNTVSLSDGRNHAQSDSDVSTSLSQKEYVWGTSNREGYH